MIREQLYATYNLEDTKHLYVGGDGAKWVGSTFDYLGMVVLHILCKPNIVFINYNGTDTRSP